MRVSLKYVTNTLTVNIFPNTDDLESPKQKLDNRQCIFKLPKDWTLDSVHPDTLATIFILMLYPFTKKTLELPIGVSPFFASSCKKIIKKDILPVDPNVMPRKSKSNGKLGLAYSSGVDSTAALALAPEETALFYVERIIDFSKGFFSNESVLFAYSELESMGRTTHKVATDFEYIRSPKGFPVDLASCIPALFLSDYENLDSIATGTTLDSAYRIGHEKYEDYPNRWHYRVWNELFKLIDLPISFVTAGISEVGTTKIVNASTYTHLAESCLRGSLHNPCGKCPKCLRKKCLEEVLNTGTLSDSAFYSFLTSPRAASHLLPTPIKHQNVFIYIMNHYTGNNDAINTFKSKMGSGLFEVDWLEKWYPPSLTLIAPKYREFVEQKILSFLEPMTEEEMSLVRSWDLSIFHNSVQYLEAVEKLKRIVENIK